MAERTQVDVQTIIEELHAQNANDRQIEQVLANMVSQNIAKQPAVVNENTVSSK